MNSSVPLRLISGLTLALLGVVACGGELAPPPLEVRQRASLVGAGTILQVKSMTNEELRGIEVTIEAESGEIVYTEERLGPYETLEVGWKKLGGWEIPATAEITVRAEGYLLPYRAHLAPGAPENGSPPGAA